jgi:acyl-[acyl-carrier-protein]-phospholipid O-acyltransferase/long-chain-fatty-acid--[acyl-carrier-protein] ligase
LKALIGCVINRNPVTFFTVRDAKPHRCCYLPGHPFLRQLLRVSDFMADTHPFDRLIPARRFLRRCRLDRIRLKVADSMGRELSGGKLLIGALLLKRLLEKHVLARDESTVGVLLPPSVGSATVNAALAISNRVAVNLNYTLTQDQINFCIREAGVTHVITSRAFLEKKPLELDAKIVFAEELRSKGTKLDTALAAFWGTVVPIPILERVLGLADVDPDDLLTIIFTSGSTGEPKGVMLTHRNIDSNIDAVEKLIRLVPDEMVLGVLPFFHSFGYTITLWWPLTLASGAAYHFNPIDARTVGELCEKYRCTTLMGTPTFLRGYIKRCTKEQFSSLDLVIVGAEKMPLELFSEFENKFGVRPSEGYGTTELSPLASVNVPDSRAMTPGTAGTKLGTVGRPVPGVRVKTVDPDSLADLPNGESGLLFITGDNVMKGYLNQPAKTAEVIHDGWYNTGDIAVVDDEGFITITGRQSRFSKIGGEMVPHIRIEETLIKIVGDQHCEGELPLCVTAVPDERKGERLIVLHRELPRPVEQILRDFSETGVPNLWIPDRNSFLLVEHIPLLGSGKLDLKRIKELALELTNGMTRRHHAPVPDA